MAMTAPMTRALVACFLVEAALGYSYQSAVSDACHEPITMEALRRVRESLKVAPPIVPDDNEQALIDDVPFSLADDMRDLGAVALLLGVRDNDLKGQDGTALAELAQVHGDPDGQVEHCLREYAHDEPDGSREALAACRGYIEARVGEAFEALRAPGDPDPDDRTTLAVYLTFRGGVDVSLPRYYVAMGQALHALQDGYSHTLRSEDGRGVHVVLNWIDEVDGTRVEARDGPPHLHDLDLCEGDDPLRRLRYDLVVEASADLLATTLDPMLSPDARDAAVGAVLDRHLAFAAGCTAANSWCDAPELADRGPQACGCRAGGRPPTSRAALAIAALLALVAAGRSTRAGLRACVRILMVLLAPGVAAAEDRPLGAYGAVAASLDHPAAAAIVAGRYAATDRITLGLDAEWNPFLSFHTQSWRRGVFNVYGTLIHRFAMKSDRVWLRSTLNLGGSLLLFDLYGAPEGTFGPYVGLAPLGVQVDIGDSWHLIVDPLGVALPVPQTEGAPFGYLQYRSTIGIQIGGERP